jgi:Tetratricopeptide repeat
VARERCAARIPPAERPTPSCWPVEQLRDNLTEHARSLQKRLEEACDALDPSPEALYSHYLGNIAYRLGDAPTAWTCFRRTLEVWQALPAHPEDLRTAEHNCAAAAFRAGQMDEAARHLHWVIQQLEDTDTGSCAEVGSALALVDTYTGDTRCVEQRLAEAMALAHTSRDDGVLARTARTVAEAWMVLDRPQRARQTLALVPTTAAMLAADRLGILVTRSVVDAIPDLAGQALLLVPEALDAANAWWDLRRLLPWVTCWLEQSSRRLSDAESQQHAAALAALRAAALQRHDCRQAVAALDAARARIPHVRGNCENPELQQFP